MPLSLGTLTLDLEAGRARGPAGESVLTPLECRLLQRLHTAEGATVERSVLLTEVWGYRASMATRTVDVAIARLRSKIEPDPAEPRWLRSERGVGYRLCVDAAPAARAPAPPPPIDHPCFGRDAVLAEAFAALSAGPVQILGLPGVGARTLARAIAAHWPGERAWIDLHDADSSVGRLAEGLGCGPDPVHVHAHLRGFGGLVVVDGEAGELPITPGPARLFVGGRPRSDARIFTLGPIDDHDALAMLHHGCRRALAADEMDAGHTLLRLARGFPRTLAIFARELRYQHAVALVDLHADGADPLAPAWEAARARLPVELRDALRTLAWFVVDFSFPVGVAVLKEAGVQEPGERIEALVTAGWLSTAWRGAGEVRFRHLAPVSATNAPPAGLGRWLASLRPAALEREVELALRWADAADPADPALPVVLGALQTAVRKRGGWPAYGAALARLGAPDAVLAYAEGEARWHANDPAGAVAKLDQALAGTPHDAPHLGELRALCGFYRSRIGDRAGARALLARDPALTPRGQIECTFIAALLDSEDGVDDQGALDRLRDALTLAERSGDPRLIARARHYLATGLLHRGDPAARGHFARAIEGFAALEAGASGALAEGMLAWALPAGAERSAAIDHAIATLDLGGLTLSADTCRRHRAAFDLAAGNVGRARSALAALLVRGGSEPLVRAMLAWIAAYDGATDDAARHAEVARSGPPMVPEEQAVVTAWLAAAGFGAPPDARWFGASPEVRLTRELPR